MQLFIKVIINIIIIIICLGSHFIYNTYLQIKLIKQLDSYIILIILNIYKQEITLLRLPLNINN